MKTAGLALDFYDDPRGELLKTACPRPEELPGDILSAHFLTPEEREVLRDDAYALILHNEGRTLRKFACVDPGNTRLSALYFLEHFDRLPTEAVKVAAANLIGFHQEFGLEVPVLLKLAAETGMTTKTSSLVGTPPAPASKGYVRREQTKGGRIINRISDFATLGSPKTAAAARGMSRKRDSMKEPIMNEDGDWASRTNLLSIKGGNDSGRVMQSVTSMGQKTAAGIVPAAIGGALIHDALTRPGSGAVRAAQGLGGAALAVRGLSSASQTGKYRAAEEQGRRNSFRYKQMQAAKEKEKKSNVVDVSGLEPDAYTINKKASVTALGGKYALDSYSDVTEAIDYFNQMWTGFDPASRHEFCVKTAARATELKIEVPELMQRYGSTSYAPDIDAHLASRRAAAPDQKDVFNLLQEKRAAIDPEKFAELLQDVDEKLGLNYSWGGAVMDPYYSTFGGSFEKQAEVFELPDGSIITDEEILAIPREKIEGAFSPEVAEAFQRDPFLIFESMPAVQKSLIASFAK